jgi:hypothetical protein
MAQAIMPALTIGSALYGASRQRKAIKRAQQQQERLYRDAQERVEPFMESGVAATQQIQNDLDTGQLGGSFTPDNFTQDPGYQFRLSEGEQGLERMQAARGNLYSGSAAKEMERFRQGLAAQAYQDAYNRWLQEQQQRYGMLAGQSDLGFRAASNIGQLDTGIGMSRAGRIMGANDATQRGFGQSLAALQNLSDNSQRMLTGAMSGGAGFTGY